MASISTDPNGNRTIQFVGRDKKRRSLRLGKVPKKVAEDVQRRVESLNAAKIAGTPLDNETAQWLPTVSLDLARKLARVGLVGPQRQADDLGTFTQDYIDTRTDLKPGTRTNLGLARKRLLAFFKPDTPIRDITRADARRWHIHLKEKYAEATAARTLKRARQFFAHALDDRLITDNPFAKIKP
ncbi:MAG TPA: phage integrase SAM-like domain-containing protein, partial [Gemmataceae bacterium]|nr:phage integrase SAM-like domain-containing protein [Gemmataceae bacterium]